MIAITKQDVWRVANEINAAGDKPTAVEIRKRLGTGSYTTITAALKEWTEPFHDEASEIPALPQEFEDRVSQAGADLFALATRYAEERLEEERIAWALVKAELEQDRAEAIKIADLAEAGMDAMRAELDALKAELEQSKIQQHGLMQLAEERKAETAKAQEATKSAQEQAYRLAGRVDALEQVIDALRPEKAPSRASAKKTKVAPSSTTAGNGDAGGVPGCGSVTNEGE